jgi:CheY-like chemotaxis protein
MIHEAGGQTGTRRRRLRVADAPTDAGATAPADAGATAARRPCVLVVEDDPDDREIYGRILGYNGFDVVFAPTGSDAMELAQQYRPDVVLLDMRLPDVTGLQLLDHLRRHCALDAHVVVLSGLAEESMGEMARRAGCAAYIEKPASPVAVLHAVEALVGKAPLPGVGVPPRLIEPPG